METDVFVLGGCTSLGSAPVPYPGAHPPVSGSWGVAHLTFGSIPVPWNRTFTGSHKPQVPAALKGCALRDGRNIAKHMHSTRSTLTRLMTSYSSTEVLAINGDDCILRGALPFGMRQVRSDEHRSQQSSKPLNPLPCKNSEKFPHSLGALHWHMLGSAMRGKFCLERATQH